MTNDVSRIGIGNGLYFQVGRHIPAIQRWTYTTLCNLSYYIPKVGIHVRSLALYMILNPDELTTLVASEPVDEPIEANHVGWCN